LDSVPDSTSSSEARSSLRAVLRGALEALALALVAGGTIQALMPPDIRGWALISLGAAWAVSAVSVAALVWARRFRFKDFLRVYGAGVALRAVGLVVIIFVVDAEPYRVRSAALATYTLGVLALLLLELRQLSQG